MDSHFNKVAGEYCKIMKYTYFEEHLRTDASGGILFHHLVLREQCRTVILCTRNAIFDKKLTDSYGHGMILSYLERDASSTSLTSFTSAGSPTLSPISPYLSYFISLWNLQFLYWYHWENAVKHNSPQWIALKSYNRGYYIMKRFKILE